jgi:FtsZ-binding cell division protein ZapB
MKLTDENIKILKENDILINGRSVFDTIEALQQETTKLRAELETIKHIANEQTEAAIDLQQENEQLQAQNRAMTEAIKYVLYHLKRGGESCIIDRLESTLSTTPTTYQKKQFAEIHPAYIREIFAEWARLKSLDIGCAEYQGMQREFSCINSLREQALEQIDKVGGQEHVR